MAGEPRFDDRVFREQSRKISSLSNSIKKLQDGDLRKVSSTKDIDRMVSTTSKTIQKLGMAAEAMISGIKNTTVGAAKYTKEALKQYGQALQQDVQLDMGKLKTMTVKGGPVIGWFLTKLMETPAFKNAMGAIKNKISETMSAAGAKFKNLVVGGARSIKDSIGSVFDKIGGVFGRLFGGSGSKQKLKKQSPKKHGVFVEKDGEILYYPTGGRKKVTDIPQLADGGVTGKGGLARLHPAEVVMPLEQLMKYQNNLAKSTRISFRKSFKQVRDEGYRTYEAPFYKRFLNGLFELKAAIVKDPINLTYRLKSMWQDFLEKHPVFRSLYKTGKFLITLPFKILFTRFGGKYIRLVSKNSNPLVSTAQTIGSFFPIMTWKMDQQIELLRYNLEANRDTAAALTGKRYGPARLTKFGRTSLIEILNKQIKKIVGSTSRFGWDIVKSLTRKIFNIKKKEVKTEIIRTPMEILIEIQSKALFRLEMIARSLMSRETYEKAMKYESKQIIKMLKITDAELGIEKKKLSIQDKLKKGIITVGDKLESSKKYFKKIKDINVKIYERTMRSVKLERKQNETLDKVSIGIGNVKNKVEKTGKKQVEKLSEMIKNQKDQKSLSKRLSERIDKIRTGTKSMFKSVFDKIWLVLISGYSTLQGLFSKTFGAGGSLIKGISKVFIKGLSKIPLLGKLAPVLSKLGGVVTKILPYADKIATFASRYVVPVAAAVSTIYGALKAQGKYGDPIGEKLSLWNKLGMGSIETLSRVGLDFGMKSTIEADVALAKSHRENIAKSELRLFNAYKNRLEKGKITQSAYNKLIAGGITGLTDRLYNLKKNKELVQVGDVIMTGGEKIGIEGAKALFHEKITKPIDQKIESVFSLVPETAEVARLKAIEAGQISKDYWITQAGMAKSKSIGYGNTAKDYWIKQAGMAKSKSIGYGNTAKDYWIKQAEKYKPNLIEAGQISKDYWMDKTQPVRETYLNPALSASEMAMMKAKDKSSEIKAKLESNKKFQEGVEEMEKFQSVIVNNFNNASNAISTSVSNAIGGAKEKFNDFYLDPNTLSIVRGDLE